MDSGIKRAICIWHRRAGKDKSLVNLIAKKAFERVGVYYYLFPTYTLAKKVIWDGIDKDGFKFIDHFPKEIVESYNGTDLKIDLVNGSVIQLIGTDKYDSIRGTNPVGCVFSEFAFQNPMAWEVIRPILAENGGWAVFNTTPNGKNHAFDMYNYAKDNPNWFCQKLGVDYTRAVPESLIDEERATGMSEEMIQQEYYCSFDVGAIGSYYAEYINQANREGRITDLPFSIEKDTHFWFDLGINDMTSIWVAQYDKDWINCVNYYENNNQGLDSYFTYIRQYLRDKNGKLGIIYLPHDSNQRSRQTGKTDFQLFVEEFGEGHVKQVEMGTVKIGIQQVRSILSKVRFDKDSCAQGVRCLENYKKEYDNEKKVFRDKPLHDWASHGADAFRYLAMTSPQTAEKKASAEDAAVDYVQQLRLLNRK